MNSVGYLWVFNQDDSTNGVCDQCHLATEKCECEVTCQQCEDAMPRKHKCAKPATHCDHCGETVDDCHCQPSGHYE